MWCTWVKKAGGGTTAAAAVSPPPQMGGGVGPRGAHPAGEPLPKPPKSRGIDQPMRQYLERCSAWAPMAARGARRRVFGMDTATGVTFSTASAIASWPSAWGTRFQCITRPIPNGQLRSKWKKLLLELQKDCRGMKAFAPCAAALILGFQLPAQRILRFKNGSKVTWLNSINMCTVMRIFMSKMERRLAVNLIPGSM